MAVMRARSLRSFVAFLAYGAVLLAWLLVVSGGARVVASENSAARGSVDAQGGK